MFDVGMLGGLKPPTSSFPVTDLSPEMSGGQSSAPAATVVATEDENFILYGGVAVILVALVSLWLLGAVAFRGLPSI